MTTQSIPQLDKSSMFHFYNKARAAGMDRKRLNKALGLIQAGKVKLLSGSRASAQGSGGATYIVTGRFCTCPDAQHRGALCKHRLALFILIRMQQAAAPVASVAPTTDQDVTSLWGAA